MPAITQPQESKSFPGVESPSRTASRSMNHTASRLPVELVASICDHLDNRSIKNLRLTCRIFAQLAVLRFNRLFISASPRDIEVFCAVAGCDALRNQVKEIIWVDTTMNDIWQPRRYTNRIEMFGSHASKSNEIDLEERCNTVPQWFRDACFRNLPFYSSSTGADSQARALEIQEQARAIPMAAIWDQFEILFQLQHEALESGSLVRAFAENIG